MKSYGQIAYEAYCQKTNWISLVSGQRLPEWKDLPMTIRLAWQESAQAVIEVSRKDFEAVTKQRTRESKNV